MGKTFSSLSLQFFVFRSSFFFFFSYRFLFIVIQWIPQNDVDRGDICARERTHDDGHKFGGCVRLRSKCRATDSTTAVILTRICTKTGNDISSCKMGMSLAFLMCKPRKSKQEDNLL